MERRTQVIKSWMKLYKPHEALAFLKIFNYICFSVNMFNGINCKYELYEVLFGHVGH